jgi:CxxC motif-containing protein (DUF1111 family)
LRRPGLLSALAAALVLLAVGACGDIDADGSGDEPTSELLAAQGGDATVAVFGSGAYAQPVPGLDNEQRRMFAVGNNFFNDNWVTAPASTEGRDGLGPLFNAQSCSSCHFRDGRAQPPLDDADPERGLLLRISVLDDGGDPQPHRTMGGQLQDRAIRGVPPEGSVRISRQEQPGTYDDGTAYSLLVPTYEVVDANGQPIDGLLVSPRIAPAVFGVGLLEGVPADDILEAADPDDNDGDGISGRANLVPDPLEPGSGSVLGRFGWKASVASVEEQNAGAFAADIGITSSLRPDQPCTRLQPDCLAAPNGGDPELDDSKLDQVTFYTRTLAVPGRRDVEESDTQAGRGTFDDLGCASCHLSQMRTGPSDIEALDEQLIRPYTDLLLHDMGPALADGGLEPLGPEWRTPPLWGIGLVETVNGHTRFLHDGRARSLEEAILWHGGEAEQALAAFKALDAAERATLLAFLESL